jgi:DNA-binding FadR family transcriptional regulator
MDQAADDLNSSVEADLEFHMSILRAAQNAFLPPFGALIQVALRTSFRLTSRDHVSYVRTLKLHRAVLDAIQNRKGALAESQMLAVLDQTFSDLEKQVARSGRVSSTSKRNKHPLHRST